MYQLKPFKQCIHYRNEQLDGMNDENYNNNAFSIHPESVEFVFKPKMHYQIEMVVLFNLTDGTW